MARFLEHLKKTDDDHSYFISRLFVYEAFLRAGKKEREQKRAKKEPKKGDEKNGIFCKE